VPGKHLPKKKATVMIETERLILRAWQISDRKPFARLNSDIRVMEYMPACLSPAESDLFLDRIEQHFHITVLACMRLTCARSGDLSEPWV
jgi:RimJ/RimL family protein N-acetyltransferase